MHPGRKEKRLRTRETMTSRRGGPALVTRRCRNEHRFRRQRAFPCVRTILLPCHARSIASHLLRIARQGCDGKRDETQHHFVGVCEDPVAWRSAWPSFTFGKTLRPEGLGATIGSSRMIGTDGRCRLPEWNNASSSALPGSDGTGPSTGEQLDRKRERSGCPYSHIVDPVPTKNRDVASDPPKRICTSAPPGCAARMN